MRAFVALNLPDRERERVHQAVRPLRDAAAPVRWVAAAAIHLTLQFLGEVAEPAEAGVVAALRRAAAAVEPFDAALGGVDGFPSLERARVVWLAVEPVPPLLELQRRVATELEPLGFEADARPFRPHLTLGRARRDATARSLAGLAGAVRDVHFLGTLEARHLDLMRSRLSPGGARYDLRARSPLGAAGGPGPC